MKKQYTKQYYQHSLETLEPGHPYEGELEDIFINALAPDAIYHDHINTMIGEYCEFETSIHYNSHSSLSYEDLGRGTNLMPPSIDDIQKLLEDLSIKDYFIVQYCGDLEYEIFFKRSSDAVIFKLRQI